MPSESSNYLYNSLINGDSKGIEEIYQKTYPKVLNYILKNSGQKEDAEDIFQKTLVQIAQKAQNEKLVFSSSFEVYLFVACKNQWLNFLRDKKKWVTKEHILEPKSEDPELEDLVTDNLKWKLYKEKFDLLSENCKGVMKLFYQKLPYSIISSRLNYSSDSVARQRVFKCRTKLSKLIKSDIRYKRLIHERI